MLEHPQRRHAPASEARAERQRSERKVRYRDRQRRESVILDVALLLR
jgi:hypothetical protein